MSKYKEDSKAPLESIINSKNPHDLCDYKHIIEYSLDGPTEELIHIIRVPELGEFPKGLDLTDDISGIIEGTVVPLDTYHEVKKYVLNFIKNKPLDSIPFPNAYKNIDDPNNLEPLTIKDIIESDNLHYTGKTYTTKGHGAYGRDNPGGDLTKFYFTIEIKSKIMLPQFKEKDGNMLVILDEDEWILDAGVPYSEILTDTKYDISIESDPDYIPLDETTYAPVPKVFLKEVYFLETEEIKDDFLPVDGLMVNAILIFRREFYIQVVPSYDPVLFMIIYGASHNSLKNDDGEVLGPVEYVKWRESQGHVFPRKC
jgi:hypothetical protein